MGDPIPFKAIAIAMLAAALMALPAPGARSLDIVPAATAQTAGNVPGQSRGNVSWTEVWRSLRGGMTGTVTIPDKKAALLIQSGGEGLRAVHNGPLSTVGGWSMLGIVALLAVYHVAHGPIKVDAGMSGRLVERFNLLERIAHWLTASSFIALALTGLNMLYGRYVLKPLIGADAFATLTALGKYAHNYLGFSFIAGLAMVFALWVKDNLPEKTDLGWIRSGGGLLAKGVHPPVGRFNVGQKLVFWALTLVGGSLAATGVMLLFPFEFHPFASIFSALNALGAGLPVDITPVAEMQLTLLWHGVAALLLIVVVIGHIYIATLGMEGAIGSVGEGLVDENWLGQHHSVYFKKMKRAG